MNSDRIKLNGEIYNSENLNELFRENEAVDSWENEIYAFLKNWFDDSDDILTYTSGSTGKPKEIRLSKNTMRNSARMTNAFFGLDVSKTALLCLPASYIAGKMMLVRALVGGFDLITVEPKANPFEQIDIQLDFTAITPYQLHHSAETLKSYPVKNIIVGGGHVNSILEELAEEIPTAMFETYGMTETASHIALRRFNGTEKSDFFTVLKGVSIRLDERNCLVIKANHLLDNEIVTNDVVELISENSFKWLGRADAVINSGGVKIHPEQVEKKIEDLITENYFISSVQDDVLENKVVLMIESEEYSFVKINKLKNQLEQRLGKYEIPKEIYFLQQFVYSRGNKILKKETLLELIKTKN